MTSRILQLAESVIASTWLLNSYFDEHKLPTPSFDEHGPVDFGLGNAPDMEKARIKIINAASELVDLLKGPVPALRPIESGVSLQAISRWDIVSKVPVGGETTFADLAKQCNVQEVDMRRILRYAMAHDRLFREPRPGFVAHSLASRCLVEKPLLRDGLWLLAEHHFTAAPYAVSAMEKWGSEPQEPNRTAFNLAMGVEVSPYDWMAQDPEGRKVGHRFALAMTSFAKMTSRPTEAPRIRNLAASFPWGEMGPCKVVDLGGSRGADSINLCEQFPNLTAVVQDLQSMIQGAEAAVPAHLASRITFQDYSFFTPQTEAADVYLIKQCFHNWPDHHCVRILENQVAALKPGTRLVICDSVVPPPGSLSLIDERNVRAFDVLMLATSSGREREENDWREILRQADERYHIKSVQSIHTEGDFGPATGVIEVVWQG